LGTISIPSKETTMPDKYDVIVVGAGPGGTAAAKTAADKGLKVLLLERARNPGDKNMSGSTLWRTITEEIFPGFSQAEFLTGQGRFSGIGIRYQLDNDEKRYGITLAPGADVMRNMVLLFRNESDSWLAKQTVKAGVELKTALATDLLWDGSDSQTPRVKGVVTDAGNFEAPVTIDASGLHSILARRAGLAKFGKDKVMLAVKYIYRLDEKELRERVRPYKDSDGVDIEDWGNTPVFFGANPEFFAAHVASTVGRGIIAVTVYQTLEEMVRARVNIHQRMQWYLNEEPIKKLLEGAEFIYCDFHSLSAFDKVGYTDKSFLPGFLLVGDAGGFANPADSWGANVAQWQGRMAAELCAEMNAKKDYSEAMFAKYEATWRDSWVGEDDIPQLSQFIRNGSFDQIWECVDDAASFAIHGKFENLSYTALILGCLPKFLPAMPALLEAPNILRKVAEGGLKRAGGLMNVLGMGKEN
jgi:electron transfer flavoprotein-quinone oxidoreductase